MLRASMKASLLILFIALGAFVFLTGCDGRSDDDDISSTQVSNQQEVSNSGAAELIGDGVKFDPNKEVSGKLSVWFYEDGKRFIDQLFEDYKQYRPNVELEVTYIPWGDYWKKLPVAVSSGNGPDLYYFHNMHQDLMVEGGLMSPYPESLVDGLKKDYLNVEQFDLNGDTYYIGVGGGHGIIYYNKEMWNAAGLTDTDIPETWQELREVALKLTQRNGDKIEVSGFNFNNAGGFAGDWQFLAGRFNFSADGKELMFDNEDFKKVFRFFVDLYQVDGIGSATFPDCIQSFMDGTSAMIWMHPFLSGILKANRPDMDFGIFPIPRFGDAKRNWHYNNPDVSMGISSRTSEEQQALAADLLTLFFADEKYTKAWVLAQGLAPIKVSLKSDEDLAADPVLKVIMDDFDNSVYIGPSPDQVAQDIIQSMLDPVFKAGVDVDTAVKAGVEKANRSLADIDNFYPVERKWVHADELK